MPFEPAPDLPAVPLAGAAAFVDDPLPLLTDCRARDVRQLAYVSSSSSTLEVLTIKNQLIVLVPMCVCVCV
jgi:hypothetical protein